MKVYISVDLEGIHGVDQYDRHEVKKPEYWKWKRTVGELMRAEVEAMYRGFQSRGIDRVVVFDTHGHQNTLTLPNNRRGLIQVKRNPENNTNFPGLDKTFDGIMLWGYHVKAGSPEGKLNHTTSRRIKYIKVNGREVGEVYLQTFYAAKMGIPLLAVSGDSGLQREVKEEIGEIPFFNSDLGNDLSREKYLLEIENFIRKLEINQLTNKLMNLSWPEHTTIEIKFKNPLVNIARFFIRKQYQYASLKGLSSCVYKKGSFNQQWDVFCGFRSEGKGSRLKAQGSG